LAVCFAVTNFIDTEALELMGGASEVASVFGLSRAAALAYLMFNLFTPPCFAALGAMSSEIKSRKWLWGGIGLQFAAGYTVAYLVYQIGTLMAEGHFGEGFVPGLIVVAAIVAGILYLINRTNRGLAAEYAWNT
jgi:ferrous iron transport protein B